MNATGKADNRQIQSLDEGMSEGEVLRVLGEPESKLTAEQIATPGSVFTSLGSTFQFPDAELDHIWVYSDTMRRRRRFCLGFSGGRLTTVWRVTATSE